MEPDVSHNNKVLHVILLEGIANFLVLLAKLLVGISTGSLAVFADALHSLTDVANNIIAWVVIRLSFKPADREHPYGHRKFETLAVFVLAALLVVLAFELMARSVTGEAAPVVSEPWALGVMLGVLLVNVSVSWWQRIWARRLQSDILLADANHTLSDVLVTSGVIVGWQLSAMGYAWADRVVTLLVALMVLFLAYTLFRRAVPVLVDQSAVEPEPLIAAVLKVPGVQAVTRMRSRWIGSNRAVDMVIEVTPGLSHEASHQISEKVETLLEREFHIRDIFIHVEPGEAPYVRSRSRNSS